MAKIERVCKQCGKVFYATPSVVSYGRALYCCKRCASLALENKIKVKCKICGKIFETVPSVLITGGRKYCSKECFYKSESNSITVKCKYCGKEFKTIPSVIKNGGGIYCSKKCYGMDKKTIRYCPICGNEITKNQRKYCSRECYVRSKRRRVELTCEYCGKKFEMIPGRLSEEGRGKYCSEYCAKHAMVGEKSANWRGGISFEPYCILFNNEFKDRVRSFFDNKCVICGKTKEENGRALCVHHVNYDKETCCNDSERLFVPLCISCHAKTNANRDYWQDYFTKKINEDYGGKCYYTKDEYDAIRTS